MKSTFIASLLVLMSLAQHHAAFAGEINPASVPAVKQTNSKLYLTAKEAAAMKQGLGTKAIMVDVRTQAEIEYVGIAESVDSNIPYMIDDYTAWDDKKARFLGMPNSDFLSRMSDVMEKSGLNKSSTVILICRSGDRSARAADLLTQAGYATVYTVVDGFEGDIAKDGANKGKRLVNGWKNSGLPWGYDLDKKKMYVD